MMSFFFFFFWMNNVYYLSSSWYLFSGAGLIQLFYFTLDGYEGYYHRTLKYTSQSGLALIHW